MDSEAVFAARCRAQATAEGGDSFAWSLAAAPIGLAGVVIGGINPSRPVVPSPYLTAG